LVDAHFSPRARTFAGFVAAIYVARTRGGFSPALRQQLHERFQGLEITECPFVNLPESHAGRWGEGLTADQTLPVAKAGGSWPIRICRMDPRQASAAFAIRGLTPVG
jgi:hypothetical protein